MRTKMLLIEVPDYCPGDCSVCLNKCTRYPGINKFAKPAIKVFVCGDYDGNAVIEKENSTKEEIDYKTVDLYAVPIEVKP